jgi:hypothetical protein
VFDRLTLAVLPTDKEFMPSLGVMGGSECKELPVEWKLIES